MKLSFSLLKQYLHTELTFNELLEILNIIGFEVEDVHLSGDFQVVCIVSINKHENSDHLQVCEVYNGNCNLKIVCGAKNPYVGMKTVLANVGAKIPESGLTIKASKIRGLMSYGMLCSPKELGLNDPIDGIIDLLEASDEDVGSYFFDSVAEIAVTPNRGYGLSVIGIARDLAAYGAGTLINVPKDDDFENYGQTIDYEVLIEDASRCPFYSFAIIKNIKHIKTPYWLTRALANMDIQSINVIVDVLHYITAIYGQPMHAYDLSKLIAPLKIGIVNSGTMLAINGKHYQLDSTITVIKDAKQIHAIAGIIGGQASECSDATEQILIEAAVFPHVDIIKTGRKLNITTDARHRFERRPDLKFVLTALAKAVKLIKEICNADVYQIKSCGVLPLEKRVIKFDYEYFKALISDQIGIEKVLDVLTKLGCIVEPCHLSGSDTQFDVTVPSWMDSIDSSEALMSEVVRMYGYAKIKEAPMLNFKPLVYVKSNEDVMRNFLALRGFTEVINWSFVDSSKVKNDKDFILLNPIAKNLDLMRPSLIPGLIGLMASNYAKGLTNIAVFEIGAVFRKDQFNHNVEFDVLAGMRVGQTCERNIHNAGHEVGFFDIKSDVVALLEYFGIKNYTIVRDEDSDGCLLLNYMHPNRHATIYVGDRKEGYIAEVHPMLYEEKMVFFELNCAFLANKSTKFQEVNSSIYQKVTRDFSFVLPKEVIALEVIKGIYSIDSFLIKGVRLFDFYSDASEALLGKVIMGFEIILQSEDKTLTGEEIEILSTKLVDFIKDKFGGVLRKDYSIV